MSPWQALHDPHLAFNVTVMRGAVGYKRHVLQLAGAQGDPFTLYAAAFQLLVME